MEELKEIFFRFNNVTYTLDTEKRTAVCSEENVSNTLENKTKIILELYDLYKIVYPLCNDRYIVSIDVEHETICFGVYSLLGREDYNVHYRLCKSYYLEYTFDDWYSYHTYYSYHLQDILDKMDTITLEILDKVEKDECSRLLELSKSKKKFKRTE
jgi:hypothetical protein